MKKISYITTSLVLFLVVWISIGSFYSPEINKLTTTDSEQIISELDCLYDLIPSSQGATGSSRKNFSERHFKIDDQDAENLYPCIFFRLNSEVTSYKFFHGIVSFIVISENNYKQANLIPFHILFCIWRI
jgi:hypothetical protein